MKKIFLLTMILVAALTVFAVAAPASAHEQRLVGPYDIEVGWHDEPLFAGQQNQIEIFIFFADFGGDEHADEDTEHDHSNEDAAVLGAEDTLQLEVSIGPASRVFRLQPDPENPGRYFAPIVPTRAGDYTFHLTGDILGVEVDETFTSADGMFDTVEPASDIAFPDEGASIADLLARIEALEARIAELEG
ncbi:MAG: hypothetical protein D6737_15550 [Chloroflexi bacterium]|nr:MAG: hypothetical protein D6737_15550 [Chloroflexota bacterium]